MLSLLAIGVFFVIGGLLLRPRARVGRACAFGARL